MDIKVNTESKENKDKKVENTDKEGKEVTKIVEKTEEKVKDDKEKVIEVQYTPLYGNEINYII